MKNLLKLCLLMAMCLSLLLVVGCAKKDVTGTTEGQTAATDVNTEATGGEVELPIESNPEGDPTNAVVDGGQEQTGKEDSVNTDNTDKNNDADNNTEPTGNTEDTKTAEVEISDDTQPGENDFEIDFGDLT